MTYIGNTIMDALKQESAILDILKANMSNPKKLLKLVTKLHDESPHELQRKLCIQILQADNPKQYVDYCIRRIEDFATVMEHEIANGNHGIIFVGKDGDIVYPIKLDVIASWLDATKPWTADDEYDIMETAVKSYMANNNRKSILAKVVLFPQFGFSGVPRMFDISIK